MQEVPYVQKTRTQGLNYSFASESELIEKLNPAMVRHGLAIAPVECTMLSDTKYTTAKGSTLNLVRIAVTYQLTHATTESFEHIQVIGEGADVGDKACSKAMTGAYKYALRQAFMIETGDDPDRRPSVPAARHEATPAAQLQGQHNAFLKAQELVPRAADAKTLATYRTRYLQFEYQPHIIMLDSLWTKRFIALVNAATDPAKLAELHTVYVAQDGARKFATELQSEIEGTYDERHEQLTKKG
jgi:hypothetical protein